MKFPEFENKNVDMSKSALSLLLHHVLANPFKRRTLCRNLQCPQFVHFASILHINLGSNVRLFIAKSNKKGKHDREFQFCFSNFQLFTICTKPRRSQILPTDRAETWNTEFKCWISFYKDMQFFQ